MLSESEGVSELDQFVYLLLAVLMTIASFLYIVRKMFKCYLSCKTNKDGDRETTFKAGFRGDSPSTTSNISTISETTPIRTPPQEMPATPPHYDAEEEV
jgi:hypothetical protein